MSKYGQVDYYGAPTPLKQLANLSAPEASMLVIQPYDKTSIPSIEKAIMSSDLNLTPSNDGNLIRINVPQLTAVSNSPVHCLLSGILPGQVTVKERLCWLALLLIGRVSWQGQDVNSLTLAIVGYAKIAGLSAMSTGHCSCS